MIYIGIDPGKSGAICVIDPSLVLFSDKITFRAFSEGVYADVLRHISGNGLRQDCFCIVEKVHAMPKQGVSSMFNFGANFGFIQGLLTAFRIPFQLVDPRTWTKSFGCGNDKDEHIRTAQRLYPEVDMRRTERCTKCHDGYADALLMAEYGKRITTQN